MDKNISLKSVLDEEKANFESRASEEKKRVYAEGIESVRKSNILKNAKSKGDKAPDFTLNNAIGKPIALSEYLEKGPVILIWYRGGWCPYCNLTLNRLQQELPKFKAENASLIALTPELPDKSISTKEKHNLDFEVLSDVNNEIGKKYGIIYSLTPEVGEIYENAFGLHDYNGNARNELPLAATYVISHDGIIRYAFLDCEYRNRAEPSVIVEELRKL